MAEPEPTNEDVPTAATRSSGAMFAVRLWKEELGTGSEYRGSVRDVTSGASRGFRDWSDLVAFMVARIEQRPRAREVGDVSR